MMEPSQVKTLEIEFREGRLGNEVLVINGCRYIVNRRSGDTVYWRCAYSWCHSRVVIKAGQLKSARGEHVCPQSKHTKLEEYPREVSIPPSNTVQQMFSPNTYQSDLHKKKSPSKNSPTQTDSGGAIRVDESLLEASNLKKASTSVAENTGSSSSSFLEFLEDSSIIQQDEEILSDEISDEDAAWKQRVLAGLKVYSEAEQIRRLKIAYEIRKAWRYNKKRLHDKLEIREKKWASSNATWALSLDWPSRSQCMKFIKPERGAGVNINQPEVPIKIIDEVKPLLQLPSLNESSTSTQAILGEKRRSCDGENNIKRKSDEVVKIDSKDEAYKPFRNRGKCPICKKIFRSSLERHLNVHYGIKPYTCEKCHKSFSQQHSYRDHCRIHTSEKPFACTLCPNTFNSNANLKRHIATHLSGRSFSCASCGKRFRKAKYHDIHSSKCSNKEEPELSAEKTLELTDGNGNESEVTEVSQQLPSTRTRRSKKRRVATEYPEEDNRRILTLTHEISVVERELEKRRQQYLLESMEENQEVDLSGSGSRLFTLEELKYAEFLQPKVVLSKSLSVFISKMTAGKRAPLGPSTANTNIAFNSNVKPFGASVPLGHFHNKSIEP